MNTANFQTIAAALFLAMVTGPAAIAQSADVSALAACVDRKAGPEGDLPPPGPQRERIVAAMAGGPQSCVGLVYKECVASTKDARSCNRREAQAWMDALKLSSEDRKRFGRANLEAHASAVNRVRAQARALCRAAASVSAWGSGAIADGSFNRGDFDTSRCEREAIAQQALIILVTSRGN